MSPQVLRSLALVRFSAGGAEDAAYCSVNQTPRARLRRTLCDAEAASLPHGHVCGVIPHLPPTRRHPRRIPGHVKRLILLFVRRVTHAGAQVLDARNNPIGSWVSRSAGGFTFVTESSVVGPGRHSHPAALTAGGHAANTDTSAHAALLVPGQLKKVDWGVQIYTSVYRSHIKTSAMHVRTRIASVARP